MPNGPCSQKPPYDVVGCAITVAEIATEEIQEEPVDKSGRVRSGKAKREAHAQVLSKERRRQIATRAAAARWDK